MEDHIIFSARHPKVPKNLPRPASFPDILSFAESCVLLPGETWVHKRDQALIFLLYSMGLCIQEALDLTSNTITLAGSSSFLTIRGKGGKSR
ncbi:hypothetical protein AGMMS49949_08230 [Alphaproteobacteria bacterium]|nr:hypothetical protein AGMMS49949_08230 [Alphaproteobacteria bacterium]GHS99332.1 hypothetical protein AGMMS50296_7440 [Alphaproteobacteria bacterium]